MRSKRLRILICSLLLMVTCSIMIVPFSAYAASVNVLTGKTPSFISDPGRVIGSVNNLTDGSTSTQTGFSSGGIYVRYTLDAPQNIDTVYIYDGGQWHFRFYDSSMVQIGANYYPKAAKVQETVSYANVKYIEFWSGTGTQYMTEIRATATADPIAPTVPSNLNATIANQSGYLTWDASTDNVGVTGYKLYKNGVLFQTLGNVLNTTVDVLDSSSYSWSVSAVDAQGNESSRSSPLVISALVKPIVSGDSTVDTITLNWTGFGISYEVWNRFEGSDYKLFTTSDSTYTITGLSPATDSIYYVKSIDSYNRVIASDLVTVRTLDPPAVIPVLAYTSTPTTVHLSWSDSGVSYEVWNTFEGVDYLLFTTSVNSYDLTGLTPSADSVYYVKALDAYGRLNKSNVLTVRTKDPPAVQVPVLTSTKKTYNTVSLSWNISGQSYEVYKGDELLYTTANTSYTAADLVDSTLYDFKIVAIDEYSRRTDSNVVSVTTSALPDPIKPVLSKISLTYNSVRLLWNDVGASYGYDILRDGSKLGNSTVSFYQSDGLTASTTYEYQLSFTDKYGRNVLSDKLSVTTLAAPAPTPPPAPAVPPPSVVHSNNPDLNQAGDHLVQGVGDMKDSSVSLIAVVIGVIILVFFCLWIWRIIKRNMSKTAVSKSGSSGSGSPGTKDANKKDNAAVSPAASPVNKNAPPNLTLAARQKTTKPKNRKRYNYEKSYQRFKKSH